jgi:hypothetical protein
LLWVIITLEQSKFFEINQLGLSSASGPGLLINTAD